MLHRRGWIRGLLAALTATAALAVAGSVPAGATVDRLVDQRPAWTLTLVQGPTTLTPNQSATLVVRVTDNPGDNLRLKHLQINLMITGLLGGSCAASFPSVLANPQSYTFSCTVPPQPNLTYWPIHVAVNADVVAGPFAIKQYSDYADVAKWIRWTWNV